jgi:hypothetical protein
MSPLARVGRALSRKLTRVSLDRFIASHASHGSTLDLGAQGGPYAALFPRRVGLDLEASRRRARRGRRPPVAGA